MLNEGGTVPAGPAAAPSMPVTCEMISFAGAVNSSDRAIQESPGRYHVGFRWEINLSTLSSVVAKDVTKRTRTWPAGTVAGSVNSVWIT
jgi:hypothetical protein